MAYQVYLYNKNMFSWDSSITKNFRIKERGNLAIWAGASNVLNHPNWGLGTSGSSGNIPNMNIQSTTFGQIGPGLNLTGPSNGARTDDRPRQGSVAVSSVLRFRWECSRRAARNSSSVWSLVAHHMIG